MTKLYHAELGLPERLLAPLLGRSFKLTYSHHALNEMLSDKYGAPKRMPRNYTVSFAHIFEVEITDGWVSKLCVRFCSHFDYIPSRVGLDLILVLIPRDGALFVKTLWFNSGHDGHATLDMAKYECVSEKV